jgi:hypothetical protein
MESMGYEIDAALLSVLTSFITHSRKSHRLKSSKLMETMGYEFNAALL